jgi:hypothetical protein
VFSLASERDRALSVAHELLESLRRGVNMQFGVINLPLFASAAVRLGLGGELVDALDNHPATPWTQVARAYVAGDFLAAAGILGRAGARPDEAEARLRAAEQLGAAGSRAGAEEQLQRALAFYRAVGATYYVRECSTVLSAA